MTQSLTIAIIDDSETDRYICKRLLANSSLDINFLEFEDGPPAEKYITEEGPSGLVEPFPPHLLLVDINMPLMDGYSLVERISPFLNNADFSTVIVMMMSSSSRRQDIERAMAIPLVTDYIVKGALTAEEFQNKIESCLTAR